jgi:hypothetical protein
VAKNTTVEWRVGVFPKEKRSQTAAYEKKIEECK